MKPLRRLTIWMLLLLVFAGVFATASRAHDLKMTGVKIHLKNKSVAVSVIAHLHALDSKQNDTKISAELARRLRLRLNNKPFQPGQVQLLRDGANGIVMWQAESRTRASKITTLSIDAPLFPERQSEATVVTIYKDRRLWREEILDASHHALIINNLTGNATSKAAERTETFAIATRFLREGIAHIFGGPDHVLFLFSLLLLGGNALQLLKIVTAFTLAHSITLSLAATGLVALSPQLVEPIIALSIVAVAALNLKTPNIEHEEKRTDWRPYLAFGFGLIHGFGFAGALGEIGLPREALGWALAAFNFGVEVGQATLVLLFAPALAAMVKMWPRSQRLIVVYGSLAIAFMGTFWFAERVFS
ncbi:MAG TPA: HupE/UreJ family protein [Abditibacteriaceae bacterium]|jgi:hypothetical protein